MTVYAEVLFIENFITGVVILILTGKIRGISAGKWHIIIGALMCGMYAFVLFVPLHPMAALGSKLLFSAAVAVAVFGGSTWRGILKTAGVFYIVSFLMGGITIAIMYMLKIPGMTGNGSFVLRGITFFRIAAGVTATYILGSWLAQMLREKIQKQAVIRTVEIWAADQVWQLQALIDTGNSLREPVTGFPVAVLGKTAGEKISTELGDDMATRTCIIPYRTIGKNGLMQGIRPDEILVDGCHMKNMILGIGENDFEPWGGSEKYELLLHQQFSEGEEERLWSEA